MFKIGDEVVFIKEGHFLLFCGSKGIVVKVNKKTLLVNMKIDISSYDFDSIFNPWQLSISYFKLSEKQIFNDEFEKKLLD